jgi:nitrite reductase/ring-hydroxylating ferredoxin subunit
MSGEEEPRWTAVGAAADWPENGGRLVQVGARRIGVYHHAGAWYALKDICPHAGISLVKGPIAEHAVMCLGHGWRFDLRSGRIVGKGDYRVQTYPVRITADQVEVGI